MKKHSAAETAGTSDQVPTEQGSSSSTPSAEKTKLDKTGKQDAGFKDADKNATVNPVAEKLKLAAQKAKKTRKCNKEAKRETDEAMTKKRIEDVALVAALSGIARAEAETGKLKVSDENTYRIAI